MPTLTGAAATLLAASSNQTSSGSNETSSSEWLNVLFMVVDDLRPQLGYQGPGVFHPKMSTPYLDALAEKSLVLENHYANYALCGPSRASLLTGRMPDTTEVWDLTTYWRNGGSHSLPGFTTLPQYFREEGFTTMSFGKIFHFGSASGSQSKKSSDGTITHGTIKAGDTVDDDMLYSWSLPAWHPPNLADPYGNGTDEKTFAVGSLTKAQVEKTPVGDMQTAELASAVLRLDEDKFSQLFQLGVEISYESLALVDAACDTSFEQVKSTFKAFKKMKEKLFLGVGFARPHLPFIAPKEYFDLYPLNTSLATFADPPAGIPDEAWCTSSELLQMGDLNTELGGKAIKLDTVKSHKLSAATAHKLRRGYYASVSYVDAQVGKVLTALEESVFLSTTVVVLFGDHGYLLGELGQWTKDSNFDLALKTPMLLHVPGVTTNGMRSQAYTSHIDIFPTMVYYASKGKKSVSACQSGKKQSSETLCVMGKSLHPIVNGVSSEFEAAFAQFASGNDRGTASDSRASTCLDGGKCVMGYSVVSKVEGTEYRYTEWANFENSKPNFDSLTGSELYSHADKTSNEIKNVVNESHYAGVVSKLRDILHYGPKSDSGWGPWNAEQRKRMRRAEVAAPQAVGADVVPAMPSPSH